MCDVLLSLANEVTVKFKQGIHNAMLTSKEKTAE
jgi:hypothetical protein